MPTITIQTAVNNAVTELSYAFAAMVNCGSFQYGLNKNGIFLLNIGEDDDGTEYTRSFTLASSDYNIDNFKRFRFIYIGADVDIPFTISVMTDEKVWRDYDIVIRKTGLQEVRTPIGRDGFGRYWKIKITSNHKFKIDSVSGLIIVRSLGIRG